jgi:hypothetical protein
MALDELLHRRVGSGMATLIDLMPEANKNLLGLLLGIWTRRNSLAKVAMSPNRPTTSVLEQ